jgi:hypothetical protein
MEKFLEKLINYEVFNKIYVSRSLLYIVMNRADLYTFLYMPHNYADVGKGSVLPPGLML